MPAPFSVHFVLPVSTPTSGPTKLICDERLKLRAGPLRERDEVKTATLNPAGEYPLPAQRVRVREKPPRKYYAHCAPEPTPSHSQEGSTTGWPVPLPGGEHHWFPSWEGS